MFYISFITDPPNLIVDWLWAETRIDNEHVWMSEY